MKTLKDRLVYYSNPQRSHLLPPMKTAKENLENSFLFIGTELLVRIIFLNDSLMYGDTDILYANARMAAPFAVKV